MTKSVTEFLCRDCGRDVASVPGSHYMLTTSAWSRVHPEGWKGYLCRRCLETRCRERGIFLGPEDYGPMLAPGWRLA